MKSMTIILLLSMIALCSCNDEPTPVVESTLNYETITESASHDSEQQETEEETTDEHSTTQEGTTSNPEPETVSSSEKPEDEFVNYLDMSFEELVDAYDPYLYWDAFGSYGYAYALYNVVGDEEEMVGLLSSMRDDYKAARIARHYVGGMIDEKGLVGGVGKLEKEIEAMLLQEDDYDRKFIIYTMLSEIQLYREHND